ncbi:uncharacterized protein METZ01_LOCUS440578 [marine metagenome]|uniref:Uncharacterized protein n=1 Tax=marine metagenome TaxID=408172 RepID=A0A382YWW0_9ZZZZ
MSHVEKLEWAKTPEHYYNILSQRESDGS